ncbi:organic cation transporter-like protein isoform X1 [Spodoptera frugiperda]|uniref:Organic cation transporter-like protein isoform X1 n=1 Tax=Spodoptera frugiperda TaxID=7108 RepID=A0A9R0DFK6_SPOFR|nr:organic cation transporter-like protein isoform X1 [Spodoptera frugiperda]
MFILSNLYQYIWGSSKKQSDLILDITGSFGRYQLWLFILVCLTKIPVAFHQLAIIFLAPPTQFVCKSTGILNGCPCDDPIFDTRIFTRTIITEFKLICHKKWLTSFSQLAFQAGTLVGSIIFGELADKFGRRIPLIGACILQFVCALTAAYVHTFELFTIFRFGIGISVGGTMVISFVILMEFIGPGHREIFSALYQAAFNLSSMALPLVAYYNRDYKRYQMVITLTTLLCLIYFYSLPETPRWLIAKGKTERAIKILQHVAKVNKRPVENVRANVEAYQHAASKSKVNKGSTADLFKTPNLRTRILAMAFNWLTCSYCYYGVAQYVGQLSGNIFLNVAGSSGSVLCGTLLSIPMMKMMGRKTILLICHFICSSCLIILAFSEGVVSLVCATVGVVTSFIVFVVVYLVCCELFPTVVRNCAVGLSSMSARIGSMVAPFVLDLKDIHPSLTPLTFALIPFLAFFITLLLPETKGCELTNTLEEGEKAFTKPATKLVTKPSK